jgi:hypothetical protein
MRRVQGSSSHRQLATEAPSMGRDQAAAAGHHRRCRAIRCCGASPKRGVHFRSSATPSCTSTAPSRRRKPTGAPLSLKTRASHPSSARRRISAAAVVFHRG